MIKSKAALTAGDGVKKDTLSGKDVFSNQTTCNCFRLLEKNKVLTHFIKQVDTKSFLAQEVLMIPIELVARKIATGSFLKRHPEIAEGTIFEDVVIEFFMKDDSLHDPLMIWSEEDQRFKIYHAKEPDKLIGDLPENHLIPINARGIENLSRITRLVFTILENAWKQQGVALVDMKIECGFSLETNQLVVADVIDNDSWRIWPAGEKSQQKDKQVYRDNQMSPELRKKLKKNYAWVAQATEKFI